MVFGLSNFQSTGLPAYYGLDIPAYKGDLKDLEFE